MIIPPGGCTHFLQICRCICSVPESGECPPCIRGHFDDAISQTFRLQNIRQRHGGTASLRTRNQATWVSKKKQHCRAVLLRGCAERLQVCNAAKRIISQAYLCLQRTNPPSVLMFAAHRRDACGTAEACLSGCHSPMVNPQLMQRVFRLTY